MKRFALFGIFLFSFMQAPAGASNALKLALETKMGVEVGWTWLWHSSAELHDAAASLGFPSLPEEPFQLLDLRLLRRRGDLHLGAVGMKGEKMASAGARLLVADWTMAGVVIEKSRRRGKIDWSLGTGTLWSMFTLEARQPQQLTRFKAENPAFFTYAIVEYPFTETFKFSGRGGYLWARAKGEWSGSLENLTPRDSFVLSGFFSQAAVSLVF